jgi:hypothetical protein
MSRDKWVKRCFPGPTSPSHSWVEFVVSHTAPSAAIQSLAKIVFTVAVAMRRVVGVRIMLTKPIVLPMCLLIVGTAGAAPLPFVDKETEAKQTAADVAAFKKYLKASKLDDRWQRDPTRLDSEEIRKAYGARRAYFTFQPEPVIGGAAPKTREMIAAIVEAYRPHSLRITVFIVNGKVTALKGPKDYNVGLMPIKKDDDARIAAAAILSLPDAGIVPPGRVEAREITVGKNDKGWICVVNRPNGFTGHVRFDVNGKCVAIHKQANFVLPTPP